MKTNISYMGLKLKNPIIIASSGLTNSVEKIKELEKAGAAAIVLKSLFEEQIIGEAGKLLKNNEQQYPEAEDYIKSYIQQNSVSKHIQLLKDAKQEVSIPIIASINCMLSEEWINFAKRFQDAGADAIELNMFFVPNKRNVSSDNIENKYIELLRKIKNEVSIPISVKIGSYFTNIVDFTEKLMANGANSVVMFNRFYEPDIDINKLELVSSSILSTPADIRRSLRWVGITSAALPNVEIVASTGIHDGEALIKQLLAGARVVQICSTIYTNGLSVIKVILDDLDKFMDKWNFESIEEFRGRLSYKGINSEIYERVQFMKYFNQK